MQKKKVEIVIRCLDPEQLNKYISPDYNKIVVINVYDKYWGPCEVIDQMVKRYLETGSNASKVDFICAEKEIAGDLFKHNTFTSKPKFFITHKANILNQIHGVDFPKLLEDVEKNFGLLDN